MGMLAFPINLVGMNDVFNPFSKEYVPFIVEGAKYKIPSKVNIQGQSWVAVNIGYVQLASTLPTEYQIEVLDTNGSTVLQTLTLSEQIVGNDIQIAKNQCIWFNENGLRGNYYIHSDWLGKILHIKRGLYISTAVSSVRLGSASIPPFYIQFNESNGSFDSNKIPANWYKKMYGIDTTWGLIFSAESVYFRTEGSLASSGRGAAFQYDAGRNASGRLYNTRFSTALDSTSIFSRISVSSGAMTYSGTTSYDINIDLSRAYATANEFRTLNRLIRIFQLVSINGVNVKDIIGG